MAPGRRRRFAWIVPLGTLLAGCAGGGDGPRAIVKTAETSGAPGTVGLLWPQVEPGAADGRGLWPGRRKYMASELGAIVHVQARDRAATLAGPVWKDLAADAAAKARVALLGASVHREYSLNGVIPVNRANELGRAAGVPACLLLSVMKFGPSAEKLELRSIGGLVKPAATAEPAKSWINCGVVAVLFRTPGGQVLWEAGFLASLPAETHTQEQAAEQCVAGLFAAWPWK